MDPFVKNFSVVRHIWGKSETIIVIFSGAAAEFALSKAVDWLYFTGKLPKDPIGRLFSTVAYAHKIVFSERQAALQAIDTITHIHQAVEAKRGTVIPDWAYRDVLFMIIDYSIRAYELLERPLTDDEKEEIFLVFHAVGHRMAIKGLPDNFSEWLNMREKHLQQNLVKSHYTDDLFLQYKKHLGKIRYNMLVQLQSLVVPDRVVELLGLSRKKIFKPVISFYKLGQKLHVDSLIKDVILPAQYKERINALNVDDS